MFSPITPQRPSLALNKAGKNNNSQRSKCYLTMAVGTALACFTLQANAANGTPSYEELPVESIAFEYVTDEAAKVVNKRVVNPNAAAQSDKVISKEFVAEQARLFYECTQVQTSGARLA
ncbi:MAG: phospholipase, partial [Psychrobacter sp.]|nr:phospholipase [Psychrobacter sp.]